VKQGTKSIAQEESYFFGEFEHSLDSQRRVAIPSNWRKEKKTKFILVQGRHNAIYLLPPYIFNDFIAKVRKVSFADAASALALVRIGSVSQECECDSQGRISIPQKLIEQSGLKDQVVLVGSVTMIQIWSKDNWNMFKKSDPNDMLDVVQKISERPDDLTSIIKGLK